MTTEARDIELTGRALELAAQGVGLVSPNPLVGCVITDVSGTVVGEGSYTYDNVIHAEAVALEQAGMHARGGTAYVSLEPHSHHSKTPPCTEALITAGIVRVVSTIEDPNPLVSGRGFERLRDAGIHVTTGVLADEASRQNEKFICWHKKQRPFVHLKMAVSLDGRIAAAVGWSTRLTGEAANARVHELRHEYDAILIGSNTALVDDPQLTDRSGRSRRRPLVRVVLDDSGRLPVSARLVITASEVPTVVFSASTEDSWIDKLHQQGVDVVGLGGRDEAGVLAELKKREIQSVLIEGGSEVAGSFLTAGLVDKITLLYSPRILGGDAPAAVRSGALDMRLKNVEVARVSEDIEVTGYPDGSS